MGTEGDLLSAPRGFRQLVSSTVWAALVQSGVRQIHEPGGRLLVQGDPGRWVVILVAGRVKVIYSEPSGVELLLAVRGPGDLLGEFSRNDDGPRTTTIQAMERCVAYTLADTQFTEFIRRHRLAEPLDRYVMTKVRESAVHTWQVAHRSTAPRLAGLLLNVVAAAGPDHPNPTMVPMSQEELASALGLARSSIAPVLADWKRTGLVRLGRARIFVEDPARMRAEYPAG
ncbi:Crp/Fnr family transcriptional regulator [Actinopolymorpha pittospori]|uniref:CRP-like cAMP-binding protein n=1 Tax=Actinopolymorpha pittospori TaxID=648752 RepID=A0A927N576_9ACTN|nr:Crp/Fnr family transcriptional regulator [Actinopolymorpha pittospori]MBE1612324.1 CRP-like cAMP-binding protein [Actinopolymorpha pittospori]